jgi:hypothetical protein
MENYQRMGCLISAVMGVMNGDGVGPQTRAQDGMQLYAVEQIGSPNTMGRRILIACSVSKCRNAGRKSAGRAAVETDCEP